MPVNGITYSANPDSIPVPGYSGYNPAAFGTNPVLPMPSPNVPTGYAEAAGNAVNNQLPGYGQSVANVGANIQSETAGQLPQDVINQIEQQGAERGAATGQGAGSPNVNAATLAALGKTSLDLTNLGQTNLNAELPNLPGASIVSNPQFYPSANLTSEVQQSNALYRAAPNPQAAAMAGIQAAQSGLNAGRASVPASSNPVTPAVPGYSWGAPAVPASALFTAAGGPGTDAGNPYALTQGNMYGGGGESGYDELLQQPWAGGAPTSDLDQIIASYPTGGATVPTEDETTFNAGEGGD